MKRKKKVLDNWENKPQTFEDLWLELHRTIRNLSDGINIIDEITRRRKMLMCALVYKSTLV
jgi:hypothetical protein